ncbi:McrB family protein [Psychrobacter sp. FDAARGOS_221]|uniref:McrB family protein n=1 Tax=Psychrobacter sp. FDAARGOS_221 TaxID=1975705 RepID=UPI000BB53E2B|nr:AAA family ATPase [Psychrobacter sp. FDAARGOS_221]PNK61127.1 GTPase [Psychrobacter sp. FDAARGOS_221]
MKKSQPNNQALLPTQPTNIIFTGVAGTGKTHRLLQLQQLYDEPINSSWDNWRVQQMSHYGWCEVVCAVLLLEDRMMTVPEMMRHPLIKDKAIANKRNDNINQTLWVQLSKHTHPDSVTVNSTQRSANYYFDKTESSHWFMLDEVKPMLQQQLDELLSLYDKRAESEHIRQHTISRSCLVSFHQSYGYDEFVEGIRPHIHPQTGQMQYGIQPGAFLTLCAQAASDPEHRYAMLIDEINRANTAQVFGELMSVIEPTKRAGGSTPMSVRLAYSGRQFMVPSNVDIYATMNTQDHSLAALDMAFRRRFEFVTCYPDSSVLSEVIDSDGNAVDIARLMQAINQRLNSLLGPEAQLGQSYFMHISDIRELAARLSGQIIPQIIEYINSRALSTQIGDLLMQVLYGNYPNSSHGEGSSVIEHCLLKIEMPMTAQIQMEEGSSLAMSETQLLHPEFAAVAQSGTVLSALAFTESNQAESKTTNRYLTAKPYQQLYQY